MVGVADAMAKPVLELDGSRIRDYESFIDEVTRSLVPDAGWGGNLDAFNDILRGGFGAPEGGFVLRWRHAAASREALGYAQTVRYLETKLQRCHPVNVPFVEAELAAARRGAGQTLFDVLVEIIGVHGPGGRESEDGVELELVW